MNGRKEGVTNELWLTGCPTQASKIQSLVQLDLNSNELHLDGGREIS